MDWQSEIAVQRHALALWRDLASLRFAIGALAGPDDPSAEISTAGGDPLVFCPPPSPASGETRAEPSSGP